MDPFDRASEREMADRELALHAQRERNGCHGKTAADSALLCSVCEDDIPQARREAVPGVQTCIDCQRDLDLAIKTTRRP